MKKKIALCFWGLCRSTHTTIDSINKHVFNKLKEFDFEYNIYLHTYKINDATIDNNYKLLNPDYYIIDDQNEIDLKLDLKKYRTCGDPWLHHNSVNFSLLNNSIRALYSQKKLTELMLSQNINYDYVIFIRPDVLFYDDLKLDYFKIQKNEIILPNFGKYPINDRFCICTMNVSKMYGIRFDHAYTYSLNNKLHSETYLNYILKNNNIKKIEVNFRFSRIRSNGYNVIETFGIINKVPNNKVPNKNNIFRNNLIKYRLINKY